MLEKELFLKEKLGLDKTAVLSCSEFTRRTRNKNYVLEVNGFPSFFIKAHSIGNIAERRAFSFLRQYPVVSTIFPVYQDNQIIIFPFISDLVDTPIEDNLEFIINLQNGMMNIGSKAKSYFSEEDIRTDFMANFKRRIMKHSDLVEPLWADETALLRFFETLSTGFDQIPKTVVHSDIHHKNLQSDSQNRKYLVDWEDVGYSKISWEIARPLMELDSSQFNLFVAQYVSKVQFNEKELLRNHVLRDFVVRSIMEGIIRQQVYGVENARPQLDLFNQRLGSKMEEIIYGKI